MEQDMPVWGQRIIYEHITSHLGLDPNFAYVNTINQINEVANHLFNKGVFQVDTEDPSNTFIHDGNLSKWQRMIELKLKLAKTPLKTLNYYHSGTSPTTNSVLRPTKFSRGTEFNENLLPY